MKKRFSLYFLILIAGICLGYMAVSLDTPLLMRWEDISYSAEAADNESRTLTAVQGTDVLQHAAASEETANETAEMLLELQNSFQKKQDAAAEITETGKEEKVSAQKVIMPASLEKIGDDAFLGVAAGQFFLQGEVREIGTRAFGFLPNPVIIHIPESAQNIASNAFEGSDQVRVLGIRGSKAEQFAYRKGFDFETPIYVGKVMERVFHIMPHTTAEKWVQMNPDSETVLAKEPSGTAQSIQEPISHKARNAYLSMYGFT